MKAKEMAKDVNIFCTKFINMTDDSKISYGFQISNQSGQLYSVIMDEDTVVEASTNPKKCIQCIMDNAIHKDILDMLILARMHDEPITINGETYTENVYGDWVY